MNSLSKDTSVRVRGGDHSYKLPKLNTSVIQIATEFFSLFFLSLPLFSRVSTLIYTTPLPSSLPYMWTVDGVC